MFSGVSFELQPGEALLLRGANGSGKSSLLRIMAGFLRPSAGRLVWDGSSVDEDLSGYRHELSYLGHANAVKGLLTARENIALAVALANGDADRIQGALELFDLTALADTAGRYLSAGQRRRLALARLAAGNRTLWLLDEPGVGLDAANRVRLEHLVVEHRARAGVVVVATHGDTSVENAQVLDLDDTCHSEPTP